ncbi:MAG: hypothetical protein ACREJ9_14345 [Candidatus Rokuibacteriota bacterium]
MARRLLLARGMDLHEAKERIAIALVESIFRRAGYGIRQFAGEPAPRVAPEDFTPTFYVAAAGAHTPEREFPIGVAYRPFLEPYIALENQRRQSSVFILARRQWPGLQLVLVTDHPEGGRSCFQALAGGERGTELRTVDLVHMPELAILPRDAADNEDLLLRIYALLSPDRPRRTLARV